MVMHTVQIGLLGCGTVGTGVVKLLLAQTEAYAQRAQAHIQIKKILVNNIQKDRPGVPSELLTTDPSEILEDPEIQVVVEVMGGLEPTQDYLMQAIHSGKHVVTANKALVATHGASLFQAAHEAGVSLFYEAAVAGGIPIIQAMKRSMVSNQVTSLYGIINGTTNYILSAMTEDKRGYEEVLKEAQKLGFAEADPTDDVEGYDAAYKLAILCSLAFGKRVSLKEIHRVGIQHISAEDIAYAEQFGFVIKLLAIAKQGEDYYTARVHPTMIPHDHPLASVHGAYNALLVHGDAVGDIMFYGQGAGEMPTASAVVADLINVVGDMENPPSHLDSDVQNMTRVKLTTPETDTNRYYIRIRTADKAGVLGQIGNIFGQSELSVHTLLQKKQVKGEAELVFITHPVSQSKLRKAVAQITKLETTQEIYSIIRVEDFGQSVE